jgi:hypothetical protein
MRMKTIVLLSILSAWMIRPAQASALYNETTTNFLVQAAVSLGVEKERLVLALDETQEALGTVHSVVADPANSEDYKMSIYSARVENIQNLKVSGNIAVSTIHRWVSSDLASARNSEEAAMKLEKLEQALTRIKNKL